MHVIFYHSLSTFWNVSSFCLFVYSVFIIVELISSSFGTRTDVWLQWFPKYAKNRPVLPDPNCKLAICSNYSSSSSNAVLKIIVASINRTSFRFQVMSCDWLCITRSSGKAPVAKRDYNSAVTMKGWLYKQVNRCSVLVMQVFTYLCSCLCWVIWLSSC